MTHSQIPGLFTSLEPRTRWMVAPTRIVTASSGTLAPERLDILPGKIMEQTYLHFDPPFCRIPPGGFVLLDFGLELNGAIRIGNLCVELPPLAVRIRFGESVSEAMGQPNQDHAIHDTILQLPSMGAVEFGETGFRFLRIDVPADAPFAAELTGVNAVLIGRDWKYDGAFESSDSELNQIWKTAAHTLWLNAQTLLLDGIKRDRLVWMGDLYPELLAMSALFSNQSLVEDSLDFMTLHTPPERWFHGFGSYSAWWVLCQWEWYWRRGNFDYLRRQQPFLEKILPRFMDCVAEDGVEALTGVRFLDWPSFGKEETVHAGLQGLLLLAMQAGERICRILNLNELAVRCHHTATLLQRHSPPTRNPFALALQKLSGLQMQTSDAAAILANPRSAGVSMFGAGFILQAGAACGTPQHALDFLRAYWGGMLKLGATSFWEDFQMDWSNDGGRIDELPQPGKRDIHAECGRFCYKGYRHSLCHGWSSSPLAWMSEFILGIKTRAPGMREIEFSPFLGDLEWVRGACPTPWGKIEVEIEKHKNGTLKSSLSLPREVTICASQRDSTPKIHHLNMGS